MDTVPKSLLDGLRFDIFERVHLGDKDNPIEIIEETELTPQIKMLMHKDEIQLVGNLLLKIKYVGGETPWIDNSFESFIPVEIKIPANRVSDAWLLDADIENFSIEQVGGRSLNVTGVLKVYEKEPIIVDKPLSQERLSDDELKHHIGTVGLQLDFEAHKSLIIVVQEMLAIAAERDRYKAALEEIRSNAATTWIEDIANKTLKGAEPNE